MIQGFTVNENLFVEKSSHKPVLEKAVGDRKDGSNSRRIVSVERQNGRKELFTTHRKTEGRPRSRSPLNRRPSSTRYDSQF